MSASAHTGTARAGVGELGEPELAQLELRDRLLSAGLLVDGGADGLYLRSEAFEAIVRGVDRVVSDICREEVTATYHFPLVVDRKLLEATDYLRSFPQLAGAVVSFDGSDDDHRELLRTLDRGEEWGDRLGATGLALCSAACHPLYPSQRGRLPEGGRTIEVFGQCFRHEPSVDPARMQVFRQHEVVHLGDAASAREHRDRWVERGLSIHRRFGLDVEAVEANDPFFGRAGGMLAIGQRSENLKIELVAPVSSPGQPTAITSANCHLDHFGEAFGITTRDGETAHSACVGFGVERVALALLAEHGLDPGGWPEHVIRALGW